MGEENWKDINIFRNFNLEFGVLPRPCLYINYYQCFFSLHVLNLRLHTIPFHQMKFQHYFLATNQVNPLLDEFCQDNVFFFYIYSLIIDTTIGHSSFEDRRIQTFFSSMLKPFLLFGCPGVCIRWRFAFIIT